MKDWFKCTKHRINNFLSQSSSLSCSVLSSSGSTFHEELDSTVLLSSCEDLVGCRCPDQSLQQHKCCLLSLCGDPVQPGKYFSEKYLTRIMVTCSTPWPGLYTLSWVSSRIKLMVWSKPWQMKIKIKIIQQVERRYLQSSNKISSVRGDDRDRSVDITFQRRRHSYFSTSLILIPQILIDLSSLKDC